MNEYICHEVWIQPNARGDVNSQLKNVLYVNVDETHPQPFRNECCREENVCFVLLLCRAVKRYKFRHHAKLIPSVICLCIAQRNLQHSFQITNVTNKDWSADVPLVQNVDTSAFKLKVIPGTLSSPASNLPLIATDASKCDSWFFFFLSSCCQTERYAVSGACHEQKNNAKSFT